jgi:hypothetical protein
MIHSAMFMCTDSQLQLAACFKVYMQQYLLYFSFILSVNKVMTGSQRLFTMSHSLYSETSIHHSHNYNFP